MTIAAFTPEQAREILQTCRQIHASGVLSTAHTERILKRLPRFTGGGAINAAFFELNMTVVAETTVTGLRSTYAGVTSGDPVNLVNWAGLLDGAPDEYLGLFVQVDGEWVFAQGACIA